MSKRIKQQLLRIVRKIMSIFLADMLEDLQELLMVT